MNPGHLKPWRCLLVIPVILAGLVMPVSAGETMKVCDRNWDLQGYIKENREYDRNWKYTGTLRDSNR